MGGLHNRTDTSIEGGWRYISNGIMTMMIVMMMMMMIVTMVMTMRMPMVIMMIRSMANMSLTVGAEDKTKTVSCYANNLALSETKVLIAININALHSSSSFS